MTLGWPLVSLMTLTIAARLRARRNGRWLERGPWDLGRASAMVNFMALAWIALISVVLVFPPNQLAGYALAVSLLGVGTYWLAFAKKRFEGPKGLAVSEMAQSVSSQSRRSKGIQVGMEIGLMLLTTPNFAEAEPARPTKTYAVKTPGGFTVSAYEWGNPSGPEILFIHGAYQSAKSWNHQTSSGLASRYRLVGYDLLGHGASDKPNDPQPYRDGKRWADELQAVLDAVGLRKPVLVAWSFGGRVTNDYLTHHGQSRLAGLVFVAATTRTGPGVFHPDVEKLDANAMVDDPVGFLQGTREFLLGCVHRPWNPSELERAVAYNMMVPLYVRRHIGGRTADYQQTLAALTLPVLAIHGDKDRIILPAMSEYTVKTVQNGKLLIYQDVGHSPFLEDAPRFNRDLDTFVTSSQQNQK